MMPASRLSEQADPPTSWRTQADPPPARESPSGWTCGDAPVGCTWQHLRARRLCDSMCSGSNATHADASCTRIARGLDSVRFVTCSDRGRTRARQFRHAPRSREGPIHAVPLAARTARGHDLASFVTRWDRTKARAVRLRHVFGSREGLIYAPLSPVRIAQRSDPRRSVTRSDRDRRDSPDRLTCSDHARLRSALPRYLRI